MNRAWSVVGIVSLFALGAQAAETDGSCPAEAAAGGDALANIAAVAAAPTPTPAEVDLQSTDGTKISIGFSTVFGFDEDWGGCGMVSNDVYASASPAKITVSGPSVAGTAHAVRAVIVAEQANGGCNGGMTSPAVYAVDLAPDAQGGWSAVLPSLPTYVQDLQGRNWVLAQKVALVVDGDWKTDPINGTHDFQASLYQAYLAKVR